jgi:hypothetical protein
MMTERHYFTLHETAVTLGVTPGELLALVNAGEIGHVNFTDRVRKIPFKYDELDIETLRFEQSDIDGYNNGDTVASFAQRTGEEEYHVRFAIKAGDIKATYHEPHGRDAYIYIARADIPEAIKGLRRWKKRAGLVPPRAKQQRRLGSG